MLNKFVAVSSLFLLACFTVAGETRVSITADLQGKWNMPVNYDGRAVLLLHGFQGHMDEVGDLYLDQSRSLAESGIASLRFNYTGEGERVGYVATSTLESRIRDTEQAFEFMKLQVPEAVYGVIGFSLGGLTAMKVAVRHPDWFQSMVLWSAAESMGMPNDEDYVRAARQALQKGKASYEDWTKISLTREFVASFYGVVGSLGLEEYPGALLTIRGDMDFLPSHDRKWLSMIPTPDKMFLLIGGADHIFNVLAEPRPSYGETVIRETKSWFDRTLFRAEEDS